MEYNPPYPQFTEWPEALPASSTQPNEGLQLWDVDLQSLGFVAQELENRCNGAEASDLAVAETLIHNLLDEDDDTENAPSASQEESPDTGFVAIGDWVNGSDHEQMVAHFDEAMKGILDSYTTDFGECGTVTAYSIADMLDESDICSALNTQPTNRPRPRGLRSGRCSDTGKGGKR